MSNSRRKQVGVGFMLLNSDYPDVKSSCCTLLTYWALSTMANILKTAFSNVLQWIWFDLESNFTVVHSVGLTHNLWTLVWVTAWHETFDTPLPDIMKTQSTEVYMYQQGHVNIKMTLSLKITVIKMDSWLSCLYHGNPYTVEMPSLYGGSPQVSVS